MLICLLRRLKKTNSSVVPTRSSSNIVQVFDIQICIFREILFNLSKKHFMYAYHTICMIGKSKELFNALKGGIA
jgi:hypothetical protein